jgi:hypothetical protein
METLHLQVIRVDQNKTHNAGGNIPGHFADVCVILRTINNKDGNIVGGRAAIE